MPHLVSRRSPRFTPPSAAWLFAVVALCVLAAGLTPARARAGRYLPPAGKVFTGLSGSNSVSSFQAQTGKHPAVFGFFTQWGGPWEYIFRSAEQSRARVMLHISTQDGYGTEEHLTPRGIATGQGDGYLVDLNNRIEESGGVVYVRFLAEMNQANNGYCAFTTGGAFKGASHSQSAYKQAFRRAALILRGGPVAAIDAKLDALGLPAVQGLPPNDELPRPKVAMAWVPQVAGTPDIPANSAQAYYPGDAYVDWVGTDFYSKFPNFGGLQTFYDEHPTKPFMFGEWALWGGDDHGFVNRLFDFIRGHRRVRMTLYNEGKRSDGPFRLVHFPAARHAIARRLESTRYLDYAPELAAR